MGGCLGGSCEVGESLLYTLSAYIRLLWQDGDQIVLVVLTEARAGMRDPFPRPWETPSERPMSITNTPQDLRMSIASLVAFPCHYISNGVLAKYMGRQGDLWRPSRTWPTNLCSSI